MSTRDWKLKDAVIANSQSKNWDFAIQEWDVKHYEVAEDETCVCGKEHIVHTHTIINRLNSNLLYPIGSECIKKFGSEHMKDDAKLSMRSITIMSVGKYEGKTYLEICEKYPDYIRFIRSNGQKAKYAKLVDYYDFWKSSHKTTK